MPTSDVAWLSKFSPKMRVYLQGRLDTMRAKSAAATIRRNWKTIRSERWAVQASLRAMLRRRTGRKWAVVPKRTSNDADFTITFRPHWYRQPTPVARQRLAALLGKEWRGDCIRLTQTEAQAFLNEAIGS